MQSFEHPSWFCLIGGQRPKARRILSDHYAHDDLRLSTECNNYDGPGAAAQSLQDLVQKREYNL